MYKSDIHQALRGLSLVSGGVLERLLAEAQSAEEKLYAASEETSKGNDQDFRKGSSRLHEAIGPVAQLLSEVSPSMAVVELHQLAIRFDETLRGYPALEGLLRPGRQALAKLTGAFDVYLQQNKRAPSLVALVEPLADLNACYEHYRALERLFEDRGDEQRTDLARIEVDGVELLSEFAGYITLLFELSKIAKTAVDSSSGFPQGEEHQLLISSIESGSPIRISLTGDSKALRLLLAMLRDVARIPYLYLSPHGRVIQTMETLARAKELGIDSPDALNHLQRAVVHAAADYANSIKGQGAVLTIDGKRVGQEGALTFIESDALSAAKSSGQLGLPKPSESDSRD